MQDNPILVEVTRGSLVESCHRGSAAIADADGRVLLSLGDVEGPVYPRSAVKAMQALPLIESGAAAAFGLGEAELAIACASHSGEEAHIAAVRSLLDYDELRLPRVAERGAAGAVAAGSRRQARRRAAAHARAGRAPSIR